MRRRHFLTLSATTAGGALVASLGAQEATVNIPLRFFSTEEALDVAAAAAQIFPSDDAVPGAKEAGVVIYIDRQLAGPYGKDRNRYTKGPFETGVAEQGYQGQNTPAQIYREGLKTIQGLHALNGEEQRAALTRIERTHFFQLLKTHTIEGMFCDPVHGGNRDLVGWRLIGFPGPRMSYGEEVEEYRGRAFRPEPRSLEQITGKRVRPSEDES